MKEQLSVMVDLETLGTHQDAIFPIIGACIFSLKTGEIKDIFYAHINQKDQQSLGRTTTPATIQWWTQQSDAAKREMIKPGRPFTAVMEEFSKYIPKKSLIWGNGATFDVSMLENAYRMLELPIPWMFWDVRDVRTIVQLAAALPTSRRVEKCDVPFIGVPHRADDDAVHQASYVAKMYQALTRG